MSWMQALLDTYDNYFSAPIENQGTAPLPVGFTMKKINIQVCLGADGSFYSASMLDNVREIAVPSSPKAEGRTGNPAPYPLYDEIGFVGGDLSAYTDTDYTKYATAYLENLEAWQNTKNAPAALRILYTYIQKGTLVQDLVASKTVTLEKTGSFPDKYKKAWVEFRLYDPTTQSFVSIAEMPEIRESWKDFLLMSMEDKSLSYASGEIEPVCKNQNHAKVTGNAKLISAKNDGNPFQYEGRFCSAEEACMVGYLSSAKMHNALKWLIQQQGLRRYGMVFVSWNVECRKIVRIEDEDEGEVFEYAVVDTDEAFSYAVSETIRGLKDAPQYPKSSNIAFLSVVTATTGRMSINFWEELDGETYLKRLHHWYTHCFFRLCRFEKETKKPKLYTATPTPYEIGCAVYGDENMQTAKYDTNTSKSITKQVKRLYLDLFSCIYNQKTIPYPYVQAAYHRILNPLRFQNKGKWSRLPWERATSITLAMLKNVRNHEEEYTLSLNTEEKDRSYLFGRLTAIADVVEQRATDWENDRQTNAVRYFTAMQQRPATTWANLRSRLEPYFAKIKSPKVREYYRQMLDAVYALGENGELSSNAPLTPRFLEGYHNQRYELTKKKED